MTAATKLALAIGAGVVVFIVMPATVLGVWVHSERQQLDALLQAIPDAQRTEAYYRVPRGTAEQNAAARALLELGARIERDSPLRKWPYPQSEDAFTAARFEPVAALATTHAAQAARARELLAREPVLGGVACMDRTARYGGLKAVGALLMAEHELALRGGETDRALTLLRQNASLTHVLNTVPCPYALRADLTIRAMVLLQVGRQLNAEPRAAARLAALRRLTASLNGPEDEVMVRALQCARFETDRDNQHPFEPPGVHERRRAERRERAPAPCPCVSLASGRVREQHGRPPR
ncbi:MAG: hypothetical protein OXT09_23725 [Myxococcales bacterium]|nr:hypothetical protein [Myxococcales bacterium]